MSDTTFATSHSYATACHHFGASAENRGAVSHVAAAQETGGGPVRAARPQRSGQALIEQVRKILVAEMSGGNPSLETVAERLGLHPRTLARRLARVGTRHQEILDSVRQQLALEWLACADRRARDVAMALGYATTGSFGRAFRRWTGESPQEYRSRQLAAAALAAWGRRDDDGGMTASTGASGSSAPATTWYEARCTDLGPTSV